MRYLDEAGHELWRSERGESVPPGTLVTSPDAVLYFVVRTPLAVPNAADPYLTLRALRG